MFGLDAAVAAAWVEGGLNLLSTLVASMIAVLLSKRFIGYKAACKCALDAMLEVRLLHKSESLLLEELQRGKSAHRSKVYKETGLSSTGLFSPVALERRIKRYEARVDDENPFV